MTQDQFMGMLRQVLQGGGMLLTTLGFTALAASFNNWTTIIMSVAGPLFQVVAILWNIKANAKSSIIASATTMPEVDSKKLAEAISDPDLKQVAKTGATS